MMCLLVKTFLISHYILNKTVSQKKRRLKGVGTLWATRSLTVILVLILQACGGCGWLGLTGEQWDHYTINHEIISDQENPKKYFSICNFLEINYHFTFFFLFILSFICLSKVLPVCCCICLTAMLTFCCLLFMPGLC